LKEPWEMTEEEWDNELSLAIVNHKMSRSERVARIKFLEFGVHDGLEKMYDSIMNGNSLCDRLALIGISNELSRRVTHQDVINRAVAHGIKMPDHAALEYKCGPNESVYDMAFI